MRRRSLLGPLTWTAVAVSLGSSLLVLGLVTVAVLRQTDARLAATIDTDIAGLADLYLSNGAAELERRVEDRLALVPPDGERVYYRVMRGDGVGLAGNLAPGSDLDAARSELGTIRAADGTPVRARATRLAGDVTLIVGRSLDERNRLLWHLALTCLLAGGLAALLSLGIGAAAARRLQRRVTAINAALARIDTGELDARAPGIERGDELGDLARHTNRALDRIERLVDAHRHISDHVAHEIRTPMVQLDARLRALIAGSADGAVVAALDAARADIRRVGQLLDSLLDIAAAEASTGDTARLSEVDLSAIAGSMADLYDASAEALGLRLERAIADDVRLRGDSVQLTRLLANLLDNALKHGPTGSRIRLEVAPGPRLVVEDDGPGIAPAERARVFDRFWRGNRRTRGHGLGLALARAIADRHALAIRVEDARPGARFIVEPRR